MPDDTLSTATNVGAIGLLPLTRLGFVGDTDPIDYYRFNLAGLSDINIALT